MIIAEKDFPVSHVYVEDPTSAQHCGTSLPWAYFFMYQPVYLFLLARLKNVQPPIMHCWCTRKFGENLSNTFQVSVNDVLGCTHRQMNGTKTCRWPQCV